MGVQDEEAGMFNSILVALDGSAHSGRAAAVATELAARCGARLVLAHVMTPGPVPEALVHMVQVEHIVDDAQSDQAPRDVAGFLGTRQGRNEEEAQRMRQAIGEQLTERAAREARRAGVAAVETEVLEGDAVAGILASIERHGTDTVVLGSRGLSDVKGLLLGSVSHKVCQLAPCNCVTVK